MPPEAPVPVRIRDATADDVPQITDVVNRAFAIETFLDGPRTDVRRMAVAVDGADLLVAEDDTGRIVACVRVQAHGPRGGFGMLAVDPDWQGNGLGRAMVDAAEKRCRALGCTDVSIAVLSLRPELLPFYRKLGYRETGTEPFRPLRPLVGGVACHCIVLGRTL
jgi:ribosomal protein S18 acetylase RimI-like enzyme